MANSKGTHRASFRAFDQLPKSVRQALANAAFNWAETNIHRSWERGRWKTAKDLCKQIAAWDAAQIKKTRLDRL